MLLIWIMALVASPSDDRVAFEKAWSAAVTEGVDTKHKRTGWILWIWNDSQFSLGFCSGFMRADQADEMQRLPEDDGALLASAFGRELVSAGRQSFRAGMDYRKEVKPTRKLCEGEMRHRSAMLADADAF